MSLIKNNWYFSGLFGLFSRDFGAHMLTVKDKSLDIPMIGLVPNDPLTALTLEHKIYDRAWEKNLPILIRASFPFAHSAIIECDKAARFIVGLEPEDLLGKYAELFQNIMHSHESEDS